MNKLNFLSAPAVAIALSSPAMAQSDELASIQQETARLQALAARYQAQTALEQAKLAPLSNLAGEGKVTLGEGAGALEAWLLSGSAVAGAAQRITASLPADRHVVVLAGDETFNFRLLQSFRLELDALSSHLAEAHEAVDGKCAPGPAATRNLSLIPMVGTVAGMLRSDVDIRGVSVDAKDRLLATAVAMRVGSRAIIPSALQSPSLASKLTEDLAAADKVAVRITQARECLGRIAKPTDPQKAAMATLDHAIARHRAFKAAATTNDATGKSPLSEAINLHAIQSLNPVMLRVYIDRAGGTLETRKSLLTALGAAPISVTGGLVASYLATLPATGAPVAAGVITCRTQKLALASVHARVVPTDCVTVTN